MDTTSYYTKNMLLHYGRQLISSKRLARYYRLLEAGQGEGDGPTADEQRRLMVERITREVVDNLIFTGSENPVVQEVRERMAAILGEKYIFHYPPGEMDFRILQQTSQGDLEVTADEKHRIMGKLIDITRETVSATML